MYENCFQLGSGRHTLAVGCINNKTQNIPTVPLVRVATVQKNALTCLWRYEADSEDLLSTSRKRNSLDHILCVSCGLQPNTGGIKLARLWELERERLEIESERTDSTPHSPHTYIKKKDKRIQERERVGAPRAVPVMTLSSSQVWQFWLQMSSFG